MVRVTLALTVAGLTAFGVGLGTASASTVEIVPGSPNTLSIAGGSDSNDIETRIVAGEIRVEDTAPSGVTPGPGCAPDPGLDPKVAFCTLAGTEAIDVDMGSGAFDQFFAYQVYNGPLPDPFRNNYHVEGGDGDDFMAGGAGTYSGGPENDTIFVNGFPDGDSTIDGGDGNDGLFPSAENDIVTGGQGDDYIYDFVDNLVDITVNRDNFDGGPGKDIVSYGGRTRKVKADLRTGFGGNRNERDSYVNIEGLIGGENNDLLLGDDNDNVLRGEGGNDKLQARGGNDELIAGNGFRDVLDGGDGDDLLDTIDAFNPRDVLRCKAGNDSYKADPGDRVGRDCETALPIP